MRLNPISSLSKNTKNKNEKPKNKTEQQKPNPERKQSFPKLKRQPTILKFRKNQFKKHKSLGHAIRDLISELTDYFSPILKLLFPNFIVVHYAYIIFMTLLCSLMMLPITKASNGQFIDTLFLAASATSQGGLNTVNLNTLTIWQQVCLCLFCFLTTPIFIHSVLAFVRLYWFERYFDGIRDWSKRNFKTRRTRTLIQNNISTGSPNHAILSKLQSSLTGGNMNDRVLSQYISPTSRSKSRRSNTGNKSIKTASKNDIDFAKPPQRTEITFGGADIDIKNRKTSKNKRNLGRVKSGFDFKTSERSLSFKDGFPPNKESKEDEDFQSRLFRGEVICRDEDDNEENNNEDEKIDTQSSTDPNEIEEKALRSDHTHSQPSSSSVDSVHEEASRNQDSFKPGTKMEETNKYYRSNSNFRESNISLNDSHKRTEAPQLHFDIPKKPALSKSKSKFSFSGPSASLKANLLSRISTKDNTDKGDIELSFQNKTKSNQPFKSNADFNHEPNLLLNEDISPAELEALIEDPKFQEEIYENWKHKKKSATQQRRLSSVQLPRIHTSTNLKPSFKKSFTSDSKKLNATNSRALSTTSEHSGQGWKNSKLMNKNLAQEDDNIPKAQEEWQDDGMDWENGKMIDNYQSSIASNGEAVEAYSKEDAGHFKEGSLSRTSDEDDFEDFDYEDEDNDDYNDDYDYQEDDANDDDDDDEDYGDDYDDGDIDFDYNYADAGSDSSAFEIIPTNHFLIGRNSKFVGLTDDQKEELGGVEYRALKILCKYLVSYYIGLNLLAAVLFLGWICPKKSKNVDQYSGNNAAIKIGQNALEESGVGKVWWGFFTAFSSFNDLGLTLTPNSMGSFGGSSYILIWSMFFIIVGNTGFPVFLRFVIWISYKLSPQLSQRKESFQFLLEHPRRCFTLLFPRGATWWLFLILIVLNGFDWIMFLILDYNSSYLKQALPSGWFRVLNGMYQSVCTRTAGFTTTNISNLSPAIQVSYMLMMYVSVMPLAISIRRTNVYEEQSLGIYHDSSKHRPKDSGRTYTHRSTRSKEDSASASLLEDENSSLNEADLENHTSSFIGMHLRRQLSFDLWFLFLGLFIICICEAGKIQDINDPYFTVWTILFEIVSAYGTVGLSLGYPNTDTSFSAQFSKLSKFIVVLLLIRGKHRGLPSSLDRAIMLPSDHLQQLDNRQFKLLGDHQEDHNDISGAEEEDLDSHHIDEEMDLGDDNRLQSFSGQHEHSKRVMSTANKDPLLNYLNKKRDQAKYFVHETANVVLHQTNDNKDVPI